MRIDNQFVFFFYTTSTGDIEYYCDFLLSFDDDATAIANFAYWAWNYPTCIDVRYQSTVNYYLSGINEFDACKLLNWPTRCLD